MVSTVKGGRASARRVALVLASATVVASACMSGEPGQVTEDLRDVSDVSDARDTVAAPPRIGRPCGLDDNGTYGRPCSMRVDGGVEGSVTRSTYCNESIGRCEELVPRCRGEWCWVPAGSYVGGTSSHARFFKEFLHHIVVLTRPYWVQATEVTQAQWLDVMETSINPAPVPYDACGLDCPVSGVTFFDAARYANALSVREGFAPCYVLNDCDGPHPEGYGYECRSLEFLGPDCRGYRLPSEAEWALAAGAAGEGCFANGEAHTDPLSCDPDALVSETDWWCGNSDVDYEGCYNLDELLAEERGSARGPAPTCAGPHPVAQKLPNQLGVYDAKGNIAEFAADRYIPPSEVEEGKVYIDPGYDRLIRYDPEDLQAGDGVVWRGGFYGAVRGLTCTAYRSAAFVGRERVLPGHERLGFLGFRLVRTASPGESPPPRGLAFP